MRGTDPFLIRELRLQGYGDGIPKCATFQDAMAKLNWPRDVFKELLAGVIGDKNLAGQLLAGLPGNLGIGKVAGYDFGSNLPDSNLPGPDLSGKALSSGLSVGKKEAEPATAAAGTHQLIKASPAASRQAAALSSNHPPPISSDILWFGFHCDSELDTLGKGTSDAILEAIERESETELAGKSV